MIARSMPARLLCWSVTPAASCILFSPPQRFPPQARTLRGSRGAACGSFAACCCFCCFCNEPEINTIGPAETDDVRLVTAGERRLGRASDHVIFFADGAVAPIILFDDPGEFCR